MTLLRNTTFAGVNVSECRVTGPAKAEHFRTIAQDQAMNYEVLTNKNADGSGGAPTNTAHVHSEQGNLLRWALATMSWGDQGASSHGNYGRAANSPASIRMTSSTTKAEEVVAWYFPFFVPAGWANIEHVCYLRAASAGDPGMVLTIETTIGGAQVVNGIPFIHVDDDPGGGSAGSFGVIGPAADHMRFGIWVAKFAPTTTGLHIAKVATGTDERNDTRVFYELAIVPRTPVDNDYTGTSPAFPPTKPTVEGSNLVTIGDPDNANAWHPVDSVLAVDQAPLGPVATILAHNDALLQEIAHGLPAAGQATATAAGHDHQGSGERGKNIDMVLGAWAFGPHRLSSGDAEYSAFGGNGFLAPSVKNTTFREVLNFDVRTPASTNNGAGTSKLQCAFVCYQEDQATAKIEVRVTVTGGTPQTYQGPATNGYVLLSDTTKVFPFTSGGYTNFKVEIRETFNTAAFKNTLAGMAIYIDS